METEQETVTGAAPVWFVRVEDRELDDAVKARAKEIGISVSEWLRRVARAQVAKPIREYKVPATERL